VGVRVEWVVERWSSGGVAMGKTTPPPAYRPLFV
jgi:hypothetical protein